MAYAVYVVRGEKVYKALKSGNLIRAWLKVLVIIVK